MVRDEDVDKLFLYRSTGLWLWLLAGGCDGHAQATGIDESGNLTVNTVVARPNVNDTATFMGVTAEVSGIVLVGSGSASIQELCEPNQSTSTTDATPVAGTVFAFLTRTDGASCGSASPEACDGVLDIVLLAIQLADPALENPALLTFIDSNGIPAFASTAPDEPIPSKGTGRGLSLSGDVEWVASDLSSRGEGTVDIFAEWCD